ncbi:MAG: hypothetical protein J7L92_06925 [Dehalococcoidia bacterium]|nr:hypothetical protein [Dehalococcoidia bacterium]RLC65644.1 MAG: hypothetical protein DRI01_00180 [Chloroflexota bacterium]
MQRIKGLKWGVLVGSIMVTLVAGLRWKMGISLFSPYFLSRTLILWLAVLIAGVLVGGVAENLERRRILVGILCAIPVVVALAGINALGSRIDLDLVLVLCIGAIIAGLATRRRGPLAGILCTIPAMLIYWYEAELSKISGFIPPGSVSVGMSVMTMGLAAIGGLISYGIQSLKRVTK